MIRQVQVTIPNPKSFEVLSVLEPHPDAHNVVLLHGEGHAVIIFRAKPKRIQIILDALGEIGCGGTWGTIDIIALQMTKPRLTSSKRGPRQYRIDDRMTIEEIYELVDAQLHLTFDYIALSIVAASIASIGIISDSPVIVAASMLVSPLMGPILGQTLGYLIKDKQFMRKGLRNELAGVTIAFLVGCICAVFTTFFNFPFTQEMQSRGEPMALLWGILVAIPSGVGVALSIANGGINALIGVAISISLLPPVVNCGITFTFGLTASILQMVDTANAYFSLAKYSMFLFVINWAAILIFGVLTLKLKKIRQMSHHQNDFICVGSRSGSIELAVTDLCSVDEK